MVNNPTNTISFKDRIKGIEVGFATFTISILGVMPSLVGFLIKPILTEHISSSWVPVVSQLIVISGTALCTITCHTIHLLCKTPNDIPIEEIPVPFLDHSLSQAPILNPSPGLDQGSSSSAKPQSPLLMQYKDTKPNNYRSLLNASENVNSSSKMIKITLT
ncbi:MAG: hypothetical protein JWM09_1332 [Francisellaceae bacterium]|nr:hypothetical protein [Francisellaceae bacterium]